MPGTKKVAEYYFYYDDNFYNLTNITLKIGNLNYQATKETEMGVSVFNIGVIRNNLRQGEWRTYDEITGDLYWKGSYENGNKTGNWTYYLTDGGKRVGPENNQSEYGEWKVYNANDVVIEKGNRGNKGRHGLWKFYNDDGTFKKQTIYYEGEKTGIDTTYYKNGQIRTIINNDDKGETISYIKYYENGQLRYSDNRVNKVQKRYFENGQIVENGKVVNKKKTGKWIRYFENGDIQSTVNYAHNCKNGTEFWYYKNGRLKSISNYKATKHPKKNYYQELKHGEFKEFSEDGKLLLKEYYKDGKKHGVSENYYRNGQLDYRTHYIEYVEVGRYESYYRNGQLRVEGNRLGFKEKEKEASPFTAGIVRDSFTDRRTGVWKYYHENGVLWKVGRFYDGSQMGEWKYYNEDGTLYKIYNF